MLASTYFLSVGFLLFTILQKASFAAKSTTVAVPLPRSKGSKGGVSKGFSPGFLGRIVREIKGNFCSELESLALQLTRPADSTLPAQQFDELINCVDAEYENPVFLVSLMSKLSRKLCEPNIYTKLKCLIVLHKLIDNTGSNARIAIMECVKSLQKERDVKTEQLYFSSDTIDDMERMASNVAELETVELAKEYADYVFEFITIRGDKSSLSQHSDEKADTFLRALDQIQTIENVCKSKVLSPSKVVAECMDRVQDDRTWMLKQLSKLVEMDLSDEQLTDDIAKALTHYGVKRSTHTTTKTKDTSKTITSSSSKAAVPETSVEQKLPTVAPAPHTDSEMDTDMDTDDESSEEVSADSEAEDEDEDEKVDTKKVSTAASTSASKQKTPVSTTSKSRLPHKPSIVKAKEEAPKVTTAKKSSPEPVKKAAAVSSSKKSKPVTSSVDKKGTSKSRK
eukprot:gene9943-20675_t